MKRLVKHNQLKPLTVLKKEQLRENFKEDKEVAFQVSLNTQQKKLMAEQNENEYKPRQKTPETPDSDEEMERIRKQKRAKK
jgi:hypothetical protein